MVGELEAKLREQLRGALFWQGFGALGADCFSAPERRTAQRARRPDRRGPGPALGALLPLFAADSRSAMSASDADLVSRAWDLGALADAYSEFVTLYQPILMNCAATTWPA